LFPYLQIVGILLYAFLIVQMGTLTLSIASVIILLSVLWYFAFAKKHVAEKSAFIYMVERITDPQLRGQPRQLEGELLDILIERDEIVEDRFDKLIRNALVLDYDHTITRQELFQDIAAEMQQRLDLDPEKVAKKLEEREEESSTLLYPGIAVPHAVPHVIVEGQHIFEIILVRNKYGIKWGDGEGQVVHTAFPLIGSKDERNFHLRALMAIAHVLQDNSFHKEWDKAKDANELRTAVLLAKRKRLGYMDTAPSKSGQEA
jgi:mannitol/fructose-specific phosphotransferase system IIA component (Ntr-type)